MQPQLDQVGPTPELCGEQCHVVIHASKRKTKGIRAKIRVHCCSSDKRIDRPDYRGGSLLDFCVEQARQVQAASSPTALTTPHGSIRSVLKHRANAQSRSPHGKIHLGLISPRYPQIHASGQLGKASLKSRCSRGNRHVTWKAGCVGAGAAKLGGFSPESWEVFQERPKPRQER